MINRILEQRVLRKHLNILLDCNNLLLIRDKRKFISHCLKTVYKATVTAIYPIY